jgi:hypothetical protein
MTTLDLYPHKLAIAFADKRRSLGRYSSLADSDHGVFFMLRPYGTSSELTEFYYRIEMPFLYLRNINLYKILLRIDVVTSEYTDACH